MLPRWLHLAIRRFVREIGRPPRPLPFYLVSLEESSMGLFTAKVTLPEAGAADSIKQVLTVTAEGAEPKTFTRDLKAGDSPLITLTDLAEDVPVTLSLVEIDDANPPNTSEPATLTFTPHDSVAPPKPGEMSVELTEQA